TPDGKPVNIDENIFKNLNDYQFYLVFRPRLTKKSEQIKREELISLRQKIETDFKERIMVFGVPEKVKTVSQHAGGKEIFTPVYQNKDELPDLLARRSYDLYFLIQHEDIKTIQDDNYQIAMEWAKASVVDIKLFVVKQD
ncbi:hypothetical protein MHK_005571, partial [Candidatus Magnetomorum sp. HK-1]